MNKYPNHYFLHFLAMFHSNFKEVTEENILDHIEMYKSFEGEDEFNGLVEEVSEIQKNNDLNLFIFESERLGLIIKAEHLNMMCNSIKANQ